MENNKSVRVLIAPLDWGLGHATRCIPLIKIFIQHNCDVFVACNSVAKQLLEPEFPHLNFLPLNGYNISYASSKRKFALKILLQIPKIILSIRHEQKWLNSIVTKHHIDLVISDNRYGLFHKKIPSVFITHQLLIQTPFLWLTKWIQKINYRFINRFSECWVPDYPSENNIAGKLSHPSKMPLTPVFYIGPLARFSKEKNVEIKYKWLIVLSGPEPQRTKLEEQILLHLLKLEGNILFVRGLPEKKFTIQVPANCSVVNHLSTDEMQTAFAQSEYVVSRSGYTTVMEILAMQKKSVLIPTPGQTEQEFLAKHLAMQHWCFACFEPENLWACLEKALVFDYRLPEFSNVSLTEFIKDFLSKKF